MGTLSSFSFSVTPPNACSFVGKLQSRTKCFLCGEFSSKRRRGLVAQGDFARLNFVIRSCYKGEDNRNGDSGSGSGGGGSSTGEREGKEKSNLATMTPAEKKSDDNGDDSPASMSSRPPAISPVGPAYSNFQSQLAEIMGDKYNLFMVEEPNSEGEDPRGGPRVSFGMLRKEVSEPGQTTLWQYVIAFLLFLLTIGSSVELGIASQINRLPPEVVKYFTDPNAIEPPDMKLLFPFVESALPLAYGVLGVQLFHSMALWFFFLSFIPFFGTENFVLKEVDEVGHVLAAFPRKSETKYSLFHSKHYPWKFWSNHSVGELNRSCIVFLYVPCWPATSSNPSVAEDLVKVPSTLFQGSLLLGLISRAVLGYTAMHASTVSIHPLVIAGWCGLTASAFNLLPVGCLDGGRAMQGAFGKNASVASGLATYTLLGLGVLGGPLSLPWGLYVLICQRAPEKPCLNDVTEVGTWRKAVFAMAITLVVMTLLPVWDELAEELGYSVIC
ncbi:putative zinc metalloprotease EGY1, chloroplastic [Sesamum angolense]|uniref:Zinc metalloprotease EGY1, chloroplastic n=1 Tax=Sesamum angolense TaxID=2727404 RepID=A0AAE1X3H1_9LAMI|nr:putative zinc metalloprotease EGY1, chloroplastic [Sesamum angolense]